MWIFTVKGFFTFVTDRKDPEYLWLRARMREHLEDNFPGVKAEAHPGADYLWRARVKRADVAAQIAALVMESTVDSHFKDVMIRTAAKPKTGNLSTVMYAVWNGAAQWQEYAPYSKVPRSQYKPVTQQTWRPGDRTVGSGQAALAPYTYGGSGSGRKGSEFDWDTRDWQGGDPARDPKPFTRPSDPAPEATDEELDAWWMALSDEERDAILDEEEASLREREEAEQYGAALRALEVREVHPTPRNRAGRRSGKKGRRRNRHNQYTALGFSDSEAAREAANRQAYLDKKAKKGGKH